MATLDILTGPHGPLTLVRVPLGRLQPQRSFLGCADFMEGMTKDVPKWVQGRLKATDTPSLQLDGILLKWIGGKPIIYRRMFNDLMPLRDEVWEMKTPDLRIFGWIYRPRVFIAAFVDYADLYKEPNPKKSYEDARIKVMDVRDKMDLDEPKFTGGEFDALV